MVSHAGSPEQVPEVQFRRGLGTRIRPAMALMVVSPARRLSANCCRLRHMRQASLRLSNEGIGSARFTKECHVKARNLALGFGPSAITTTATLGQNFRSCGRRPIPLPAASVRHNHITPAGMGRRRSSASSAELARATERPTSRSTLSRTRYWIALSSMRSTSGTTLHFDCVHTIGESARSSPYVRLAYADCWCWAR